MGANSIPTRADTKIIDQTWFNLIQAAICQDFVPRNASGVATDSAGSLGSTTYLWANLYTKAIDFIHTNGNNAAIMQSPAGLSAAYTVTLFAALPGSVLPVSISSTGVLTAAEIVAAQIGTNAVTNAKIIATAVTTAKFLDGNVTDIKLAAKNSGISGSCDLFAANSATFSDITNLSVTLTTIGRPVLLTLKNDGGGVASYIETPAAVRVEIIILRGATEICRQGYSMDAGQCPLALTFFDTSASAGSNTWKAQYKVVTGGGNANIRYYRLCAVEL